jgi:SAM-dependent methyltransferase
MDDVTYEGRDLEVLADMPTYYAWIMESFTPYISGTVIEYGAGTGTISRRVAPLAEKIILVEPSKNLAAHLQIQFSGDPKFEVACDTLEHHAAHVPDGSSDTVILVNVLEHIEDDRGTLVRLLQILKPGGHLLIFVPALPLLMSKLDVIHGHFRRYKRPDLTGKVRAAGGAIMVCRYFDVLGVMPWLLLNKILGSTAFNPVLVRLNDRIVIPVSRFIESLHQPEFGKNLILVASKPAADD